MGKYTLSRFAHSVRKKERTVLYHSLNMIPIEITSGEIDINQKMIKTNDPQLVATLKEAGIVIDNDQTDNDILTSCRKQIKEPYISTVYFFLTKNCNLACKYCFEKQSETKNSQEGVMSLKIFQQGLDFFIRLIRLHPERFIEKKTIIFYGGEPFHNKHVLLKAIKTVSEKIKQHLLPDNTKMLVVTNGTLLTDTDIRFLKEHNVTITFSLDGDRAASANRVYPDGKTLAWEKATENFKKCAAAGIDLNIACTLTPQTIARQAEVLEYFINIGVRNIGFNVILDNDIIQLGEKYDSDAADFVTSAYQLLSAHGISENRTRRRIDVFRRRQPCLFDCNATGGRQIAIAPEGDVGICHEHIMDKRHFVTSIYDETFDPRKSDEYKMWHKRSPLYIDECLDCVALGVCGGGCVINPERKFNSLNTPDARFCKQTLSILNEILL